MACYIRPALTLVSLLYFPAATLYKWFHVRFYVLERGKSSHFMIQSYIFLLICVYPGDKNGVGPKGMVDQSQQEKKKRILLRKLHQCVCDGMHVVVHIQIYQCRKIYKTTDEYIRHTQSSLESVKAAGLWLVGKAWPLPHTQTHTHTALCYLPFFVTEQQHENVRQGLAESPIQNWPYWTAWWVWSAAASSKSLEPPAVPLPGLRLPGNLDQWLQTDATTWQTHTHKYSFTKAIVNRAGCVYQALACFSMSQQQITYFATIFVTRTHTTHSKHSSLILSVYTQTNILLIGWSEGLVHTGKSLALELQKAPCTQNSRLLSLHQHTVDSWKRF